MYLPQKTVDYAHNDYLQWFLELGIPGATLLIGTVGFVFIGTIRSIQKMPAQATLAPPANVRHRSIARCGWHSDPRLG